VRLIQEVQDYFVQIAPVGQAGIIHTALRASACASASLPVRRSVWSGAHEPGWQDPRCHSGPSSPVMIWIAGRGSASLQSHQPGEVGQELIGTWA